MTRYFLFLPVSLEIDLPLRIADKTNQRRTRCPPERSPPSRLPSRLPRRTKIRYLGTAFLKERINLKALKLLESCSRLACHCDALCFCSIGAR